MSTVIPPHVHPHSHAGWEAFWKKLLERRGLYVSLLVHLCIGVAAAFWIIKSEDTSRQKFTAPGVGADAARQGTEHKVSLGRKQSTMSAPEQARRVVTTSSTAALALPEMPEMPSATSDVFANRAIGRGGSGSAFDVAGQRTGGSGDGKGSGIEIGPFRIRAKSIVFLIDVSDSMVMSAARPAGNGPAKAPKGPATYASLEREVGRSLRALDPAVSFGVVCFAGDVEQCQSGLVLANDVEKEKAIKWVQQRSPALNIVAERRAEERKAAGFEVDPKAAANLTKFNHAGTRTSAALDYAFAMNPDAICLVSDGIPTDMDAKALLAKVAEKQKQLPRPASIHVMAYLPDSGQAFMKSLAEENQGMFKEIKPGMQSFGF